jgi:adenosine kinase
MSLSPDNVVAMNQWAQECIQLKIPFVFDPGQVTPAFTKEMLDEIIPHAPIVIGNEFEVEMMQKKMGISFEEFKTLAQNLIVTKGTQGSSLFSNQKEQIITCAKAKEVQDPTGAGDGYRAGLLYGLMNGVSIFEACQIGSVVGSFVVETIGPQTQIYNLKDVKERFENTFSVPWKL